MNHIDSPSFMPAYYDALLRQLALSEEARRLWRPEPEAKNWSTEWTSTMTTLLAQAAKELLPDTEVARKGRPDKYERNEYFALDLVAYDDRAHDGWGVPILAIEHENSGAATKLQYCAWKLLCVRSHARLLVAYISSVGRTGWMRCSEEVDAALNAVRGIHRPESLASVIGDWDAPLDAGPNGWKSIFTLRSEQHGR